MDGLVKGMDEGLFEIVITVILNLFQDPYRQVICKWVAETSSA